MSGLRKLTGANWADGGELAEGADVLMWLEHHGNRLYMVFMGLLGKSRVLDGMDGWIPLKLL